MARTAIRALLAVLIITAPGCGPLGLRPSNDEPDAAETDTQGEARGATAEDPVSELVAGLPTERKVAQLMLVGFAGTDTADPVFSDLEQRDYGGLVIDSRNYLSADQVGGLIDEALSVAREADHVTPWIMAPQEGGEFSAFADLPPDLAPAELGSTREAADQAEETGAALSEIGVTGILGPVLDVGTVAGGALGERAYADIPERVRGYGLATIDAFEKAGLFSAAKHFPGLGAASQSTEQGPANVGLTLDELAARDLVPFRAAIEAGLPGVVVGHGLYGVDDFITPASTSEKIVTDLLRDDLGFEGVAIADDVTAPAITATFETPAAAVDAVRAGVDMVYVSGDEERQREVYDALLAAVRDETIGADRIDEAVTRNLVAKRRLGVLELDDRRESQDSVR
jgi:beta-N-acetylhexosaminidase